MTTEDTVVLTTALPVDYELAKKALLTRLEKDPSFIIQESKPDRVTFTKDYDFPAPIKTLLGLSSISTPQTIGFDDRERLARTEASQRVTALGCEVMYTLVLLYSGSGSGAAQTTVEATIRMDLTPLGAMGTVLRPLFRKYFEVKFDKERQIEFEFAKAIARR